MVTRFIQSLGLALYARPEVRAFTSSRLGRPLFEAAYSTYKTYLEAPAAKALGAHVAAGHWAIDVGANIGFFSRILASAVSQGGKVIAVEPEPANFERLVKRLEKGGLASRVQTVRAAVGRTSGQAFLRIAPEHPGNHSLSRSGGLPVTLVTIDDLVAAAGQPPVGLIKIDTQGAEMEVLSGAVRTLETCSPVLFIEIDRLALAGFEATPEDVVSFLESRGYGFQCFSGRTFKPIGRVDLLAVASRRPYLDVLCLPGQVDSGKAWCGRKPLDRSGPEDLGPC